MSALQLTVLAKKHGPLTKRISLAEDGSLKSDGSACVMSSGTARRFEFDSIQQLASRIEKLEPHEVIALGRLRLGLADRVEVTTKRKLNGAARPDIIARTRDYLVYQPGEPALALVDYDTKAIPDGVAAKIEAIGGLWPALVSVLPALPNVARVIRSSTSAGLFRADTGEPLPSSGGLHVFLTVQDGSDIERGLMALHARCWLAGFGWLMVGAGGQLLERSIVDRVVGSPERLVFEGAPVLDPPLAQDTERRRCVAVEGEALDTISACPPLTILEQAKLRELRAKDAHRLAADVAKARAAFIDWQSHRLVERTGMEVNRARRAIERQCEGVLLPDVLLPFDDEELASTTVADVLADPARFEGETLADPLEGPEYGRGKARIMRRADGTPWINSFAHGHTIYELRFDRRAAEAAMDNAAPDEAEDIFVRHALAGDLDESEIEALRNLAHERSGTTKRALDRKLRDARQKQAGQRAQQERDRRIAERQDPRPQIPAPMPDAEWLPIVGVLDDVLGQSPAQEPPMRDFDGHVAEALARCVQGLHALTAFGSNREDTEETHLPPPEQLVLSRLSEPALAELIERHIEFVDEKGRPVHLGTPFVKHYLHQPNSKKLPLVTGLSTMPIVLPDGAILTGPGLVRHCNTLFRVPSQLRALLPKQEDCTPPAVSRAMRFLTHDWLCDVATDYQGRCIIIACALTIIERALFLERPAFIVQAGKRGGGKTTTLNMISTAVLGQTAAAAAWSPNEEERRKALFAYFIEGVPFLVWDNITRGTTISCSSIEKSLTAEFYTDRILGFSERKLVPVTTIQAFTGNNIAPRGDLASRSLKVPISVDRPDPENRGFAHPDPIGWTKAHRGRILQALYTILLGNPRRDQKKESLTAAPTRFKGWWDLVGSAIEHAAMIVADELHWNIANPRSACPTSISFKAIFLVGEADDEEDAGLAKLLTALRAKWGGRHFQARDVADFLQPENTPPTDDAREMLAALTLAAGKPIKNISASTVTWCLKKLIDAPVQAGKEVLILKSTTDRKYGDTFIVEASNGEMR